MNNNTFIREKIMDLRDTRIGLQRQIATLEDTTFWTPWLMTAEEEQHLAELRLEVQLIKVQENALRKEMQI